jgi:hypothetical protein
MALFDAGSHPRHRKRNEEPKHLSLHCMPIFLPWQCC